MCSHYRFTHSHIIVANLVKSPAYIGKNAKYLHYLAQKLAGIGKK